MFCNGPVKVSFKVLLWQFLVCSIDSLVLKTTSVI